jgi:hypothetical protein
MICSITLHRVLKTQRALYVYPFNKEKDLHLKKEEKIPTYDAVFINLRVDQTLISIN